MDLSEAGETAGRCSPLASGGWPLLVALNHKKPNYCIILVKKMLIFTFFNKNMDNMG
jgi:hypothetical protein